MVLEDDRLHSLLKGIGSADGPEALQRLAQDHGPLLLGTPGSASALISGGEADAELRLALFDVLVNEARMDVENQGRLGEGFLAEAKDAIAALSEAGDLEPETGLSLARAYARAEVEVPEALVSFLLKGAATDLDAEVFMEDVNAQIDDLRRDADGDDYVLHTFLNEILGAIPVPLRSGFVRHMASRNEAWCGRLALYWLLDPAAEVRLAAAVGIGERAQRGSLDTLSASALPLIRTWLPADGARPILDVALREARRHGLVGPLECLELQPSRLLGSLPDGSGSQNFAVVLEGADGPAAALVLLKIGHGMKDAFLVRGEDTEEVLSQLAETGCIDLAPDALEPALSAALAEGLSAGKPAPPGLIDVVQACGLGALRPQPMVAQDWLSRVDPGGKVARLPARERKRLIERSEDWSFDHEMVETWFEGTAIVDKALAGVDDPRQLTAALWAASEKRRGYWALLIARAAHVMKTATGETDWRSFVATAAALIDGTALEKIPVMEHILRTSIAAWQAEEYGLHGSDDQELDGDFGFRFDGVPEQ